MRSTAVQLAKWNPNKRSHFTLLMTLGGTKKRGLAQAQRRDTSGVFSRALAPSEPLASKDAHPRASPRSITLPHTTPAEHVPKNLSAKSEAKVGNCPWNRPNGKRTNRNFKSPTEKTSEPPKILLDPSI